MRPDGNVSRLIPATATAVYARQTRHKTIYQIGIFNADATTEDDGRELSYTWKLARLFMVKSFSNVLFYLHKLL